MYTVENIISKKVTTKFGDKDVYSIQCGGELYSYGFKKPVFNVGDTVDFKHTDGTYGKSVDLTSLRVISKASPGTAPVGLSPLPSGIPPSGGPATRYGPPVKPFPIPPLHGDRAIVRQNALTNAREAVYNMGMNIDLAAPITDEEYAKRIIAMARMFEAYSCGDLDLERAMEEIAKEKA